MARLWRRRRAGTADQADAVKAAPRGGGAMVPLSEVIAALNQGGVQPVAPMAEPMPRPEEWTRAPFGPGMPLLPAPINAPRTDTGRAEPRVWDYPTSWNIYTNPDRLVPWETLRSAADAPLVRQCIEHRQRELTGLDWDITVSQGAIEEAVQHGASKAEAVQALQRKLAPDIRRLVEFWQQPDPEQGLEFDAWLWQLIEEQLVLDAVAIYPRVTYGGDLVALRVIDGSTIKVLLDEYGARPAPPAPAYQQILHSFPRGEFTAEVDAEGNTPGLTADQLIYRRRAVRTWTPYGFSPVEHVLVDLDLWLKRHAWMLAEYTEGVTPEMVLKTTGGSQWTARQLLDYERDFNDQMSGNLGERRRVRILPPGLEPAQLHDGQEKYRPDYDMHLIKLVCSHFGVPPTELGFSETKGLGSAGFSEGQASINYKIGLVPDAKWWARLLTRISQTHLGMPRELEFRFLGIDEEDERDADAIAEARVRSGRMTLNEARDVLGLPRYEVPEANRPMVFTGSGLVPVEGAAAPTPAPITPPGAARADEKTSPGGGAGDGEGEGGEPGPAAGQRDAAKAELATFRRWARKHPEAARPFEFTSDPGVLLELAPDLADDPRAVFKAADGDEGAGGDGDPKAQWAGWAHDEALAGHYAGVIARALVRAVKPTQLAREWINANPTQKAPVRLPEPRVWLDERGTTAYIAAALDGPLTDLWAEGALLGDTAARAAATGRPPDWQGWQPGQPAKARRRFGGLKGLAGRVRDTVRTITRTRVADLARVLRRGRDAGWTAEQLDAEIRRILDDAAARIALTEVTAASSHAARLAYADVGVARVRWVTDPGSNVCPVCLTNEADGAVDVGEAFSSGDTEPPAHPNCRCSLLPAT